MRNLSKIITTLIMINLITSTSVEATMPVYKSSSDKVLESRTLSVNEVGTINTGGKSLNVRKSASTNAKVLGSLANKSTVEIVDKSIKGWYKIKYKSSYGYVSSEYVLISVAGVKLNKTKLSLEKGSSETLKATVTPSNKGVTWTSSNSKIVTVDKNGKVKAIAAGTATITVKTKDQGKTAKCTVTVNNISKARQKILDNAKNMVYFEWTHKYGFSGWRAKNTFKAGVKYRGIPYSQNVQVRNSSDFLNKIKSRKDLTVKINNIIMPRYGNDCSGFVSAAWQIPRQTTSSVHSNGYVSQLSSFSNLQPGDAINNSKKHIMLFVRWADSSKTKAVVYEQTPPQAKESIRSVSDLKAQGYKPVRLKDKYLNKIN